MADKESPIILRPPAAVLTGQTTKQPVVWGCRNPECIEDDAGGRFEFESDYPECPKCGLGPPQVAKRTLIHLLVPDKQGRIVGEFGRRFKILCSPKRRVIATLDNGEAGTGDMAAANCPGCLAEAGNTFLKTGNPITKERVEG